MIRQGCSLLRSLILVAPLVLGLNSCASYQSKIDGAYSALESGDPARAAESLKEKALTESDDQLVYLLEYATALQYAGNYQESIKAFLSADKIADIQDYHSISKITGSLLLNEGMVQYKGEDFEKVLINAMLAIDYLAVNKFEDAMVEAKRLNLRLVKYKNEAKRDYDQNPFARYISAMIYENDRDWDGAIIDYEETYKLNPNMNYLKEDLIYASKKAHRDEANKKWREQFPDVKVNPFRDNPQYGEIVFIFQQGQGPIKKPNPQFQRIPKLYPRYKNGRFARMEVSELGPMSASNSPFAGAAAPMTVGQADTEPVFSVTQTAIKNLDDLYAGLIAKRAAGIATKAIVADQVRQKNETLGNLLWIGMNLADQADLRQWATLPESFQIARIWVKAGTYQVKGSVLDSNHSSTGIEMPLRTIEVKPRKKTFFTWRSFR